MVEMTPDSVDTTRDTVQMTHDPVKTTYDAVEMTGHAADMTGGGGGCGVGSCPRTDIRPGCRTPLQLAVIHDIMGTRGVGNR